MIINYFEAYNFSLIPHSAKRLGVGKITLLYTLMATFEFIEFVETHCKLFNIQELD